MGIFAKVDIHIINSFVIRWERRVCVFRSVCYNRKELRWKYYLAKGEPPPALLFDNGTITTFPADFAAIGLVNAVSLSTWKFYWQVGFGQPVVSEEAPSTF